jgi:RNA polymerase sigma-70 factor (ECF subfamily)
MRCADRRAPARPRLGAGLLTSAFVALPSQPDDPPPGDPPPLPAGAAPLPSDESAPGPSAPPGALPERAKLRTGPGLELDGMGLPEQLLAALSAGDRAASGEIFRQLYAHLHSHAARLMSRQPPGHTLQATALVGEAYLRLFGESAPRPVLSREHLLAMAARAMRWVLIDHARTKRRDKRGGGVDTVPLDGVFVTYESKDFDLLALDEALEGLGRLDPDLVRLVELRFFGGLSMEEVATVLGKPLRSLERDWTFAKAWLMKRMA